jgi:DNA helicase-2/ATP-dependent DNA helicase PcrA
MTRAREELYLTSASSRLIFGNRQYNPPSRFLADIESTDITPIIAGGSNDYVSATEPRVVMDDELDLSVGDQVKHQLFGVGKVVGIDGTTISIAFNGRGVKKLNSAFAPLTRIQS